MMDIIVACGKIKVNHPAKARDLYIGQHYALTLELAKKWASVENIYIFSAKHGVVSSDTILEPYEQVLQKPGAISLRELQKQIQNLSSPIWYLGGRDYLRRLLKLRNDIIAPLQDNKWDFRMGKQKGQLIRWINEYNT